MENIISKSNFLKLLIIAISVYSVCSLSGCKQDDPVKEDTPELITRAKLTFAPAGGGSPIIATATDPDGDGVQNITVDGSINLEMNKTYVLSISLINELAVPTDPGYNITDEVEAEGVEHMFFFSWTNNVFSDPAGDGNIDKRSDVVNYEGGVNSKDENNLPLGLTTTWASASTTASGLFRVMLKHQPNLKSETSDSNIGETDLDITFSIEIL